MPLTRLKQSGNFWQPFSTWLAGEGGEGGKEEMKEREMRINPF